MSGDTSTGRSCALIEPADPSRGARTLRLVPDLVADTAPELAIVPGPSVAASADPASRSAGLAAFVKVSFDVLAAATLLVLFSPMFLLVALAVRGTSRGPAVFRQTRVGRGGRTFTILKFRTMYGDAEVRRGELIGLNESTGGVLFKMRQDPRVTPIGRMLRRLSIDELPQLLNVLTGSMSLVGPRAPLPAEVSRYDIGARRRLLVRPGLTGLWQVSGRSDLSWEDSLRLDLRYVDEWSLRLDLLVLAKTFPAVFRAEGAY